VLKLTQQVAADILADDGGAATAEALASEREFLSVKLAGLFNLSSDIAEDMEAQEKTMRERAKHLRQSADTILE
jgi:adenine deaminase